jgi:hypothetical protein
MPTFPLNGQTCTVDVDAAGRTIGNDYARLPATAPSEALRRATIRLLGSETAAAGRITRLWHQQAILQIYEDFCRRDTSDCAACPFPEQTAASADTPPHATTAD